MGLFDLFKSDKFLDEEYEKERQRWMNTGFNGDGSHTKKMNRLNKEISRRSAKKSKKEYREWKKKHPNEEHSQSKHGWYLSDDD